ncbi:hypothetical protein GMRT_12776 [Giardia muris]|uniref:Uncharacterized protein n=1 Tax=Giardia muris TaxID=5742 RepID=A0A4Z1SN28_GIAMU|nr:hypothetical protein GMRT_12776 [Giardia muris]|eukprot:TNJ27144.1 hypothetical protein GMRT_12776 [Giardia muris]
MLTRLLLECGTIEAGLFDEAEIMEARRRLQAADLDVVRAIEPANHVNNKKNLLVLSTPSFTDDGRKVIDEIASKGRRACDLGLPASCGKIIQEMIPKLPKAVIVKKNDDFRSIQALKEAGLVIESPGIDSLDLPPGELQDLRHPHCIPSMRLLTDLKKHTGEDMFPCVVCKAPVGYGFVCPVETCAGCMHFSCIHEELCRGLEGCHQCGSPFPEYLTPKALEVLARHDTLRSPFDRDM